MHLLKMAIGQIKEINLAVCGKFSAKKGASNSKAAALWQFLCFIAAIWAHCAKTKSTCCVKHFFELHDGRRTTQFPVTFAKLLLSRHYLHTLQVTLL